ncbi:hypothetical protein [Streptomyces coelicoflavus]
MSQIGDDFHQADKAVVEPWECDATETVAQAEGLFELVLGGADEVGDFAVRFPGAVSAFELVQKDLGLHDLGSV